MTKLVAVNTIYIGKDVAKPGQEFECKDEKIAADLLKRGAAVKPVESEPEEKAAPKKGPRKPAPKAGDADGDLTE